MASGPYSRVYWSIVDDPMFDKVYRNPSALGTWLQMLLIADAMWPASAPMPPRNPTVRMLIDCSLIIEKPGNRYSVRGQQVERERRSGYGRNAAAVRWQSGRNAESMHSKAKQSKEEKDANASNGTKPETGPQPPENGAALTDEDRALAIARNTELLRDPTSPEAVRRAAVKGLERLGVEVPDEPESSPAPRPQRRPKGGADHAGA